MTSYAADWMTMLEAPPGRICVLVVEDDDAVVETVAQLLDDNGYAVLVAYGGEQAWLTMQKHAPVPDLVLLGLRTRADDGWSLLPRVHADPTLYCVPVIVMSPLEAGVLGGASKIAAYIGKPLELEALLVTIRLVL